MFRPRILLIPAALLGGLALAGAAEPSAGRIAYIPAGADFGSIRFEKLKLARIVAGAASTGDSARCPETDFREPGGSAVCSPASGAAPVEAYEVTYSYTGQPLASDDQGSRSFTFAVYFRPEELPPALLKSLRAGKMGRSETAGYFAVRARRELSRSGYIAVEVAPHPANPGAGSASAK